MRGPRAVAAVTTGNRIFFVLQALLMALTAGTTALVARAWGAGNRAELIGDYVVKASILVARFRSGRWQGIEVAAASAGGARSEA